MGWCTTPDLDRFLAAAGGYLRSRAAENSLLLSAAQAASEAASQARAAGAGNGAGANGAGLLYGWWEPPDGSGPRGAFLHDQSASVLVAGRAPENAAALVGALARTGRWVSGVDAPTGAADAFAAAWSQRSGVTVRVHKHSRVYRLAGAAPSQMGPPGRHRVATWADRALLVEWLRAFGAEVGELSGVPEATADDLLAYGGAAFWEAGGQPAAMATTTRPVAGTVRLDTVYTPPMWRHNGYATSVMLAVSRAALAGPVSEVVLITESNSPDRQAARLGYQFVGERTVLRFGQPTGPMPRAQTGPMKRATGPIPRIPTGPMPRLRG
jgi:hypothetical protein